MIAKLAGVIDDINDDSVVIDVRGVGYLVFCSARTLSQLVHGQAAQLHIETHVREDHIHLYGFRDSAERNWFRLLTTVQGVGARVALAILSVFEPDQLTNAIAASDKTAFTKAPGVGPKLASRLISELKDKVNVIALTPRTGRAGAAAGDGSGDTGAARDAVSALVNLGYAPAEAFAAVSQAAGKLPKAGIEALIKAGLAELAPREHSR
ncbi:MAG: Holliday junction branch migration protein RuvA [Rhodospirillales bacterium]